MSQAPYSPMRKAEKFVSQEEMWTKLARHAKPTIVVKAPLEWLEPVRTGKRSGYVLTACGLWSISKDDSGTSVSYTAWKRSTDPATNLGCVASRAEAERLIEEVP